MNPSEKFNNTPSVSDITRSNHTLPKFMHWSFSSNLVLLSVMNSLPLSGSIHSTHCSLLGAGSLSLSVKDPPRPNMHSTRLSHSMSEGFWVWESAVGYPGGVSV